MLFSRGSQINSINKLLAELPLGGAREATSCHDFDICLVLGKEKVFPGKSCHGIKRMTGQRGQRHCRPGVRLKQGEHFSFHHAHP